MLSRRGLIGASLATAAARFAIAPPCAGVVLIARERVQLYLDTEGAYWIDP